MYTYCFCIFRAAVRLYVVSPARFKSVRLNNFEYHIYMYLNVLLRKITENNGCRIGLQCNSQPASGEF